MNKTTHTPGPWQRNIKPAKKYPTVFSGRNKHVAYVATEGLSEEEIEANIDLITAAPDMMDVIKRYEAWEGKLVMNDEAWQDGLPVFTQELYDEWIEIQSERNAAVAKAKGGS